MNKLFITLVVGLSALALVESSIFNKPNPWEMIDKRLKRETSSRNYYGNWRIVERYLKEEQLFRDKHNRGLIEALELFLQAQKLTKEEPKCNSEEMYILKRCDEFLNQRFYGKEMERPEQILDDLTTNYARKCPDAKLNWKETRANSNEKPHYLRWDDVESAGYSDDSSSHIVTAAAGIGR